MTANFVVSRAQLEEAIEWKNPGELGHYQHGVFMARVTTQKDNRAARVPQAHTQTYSMSLPSATETKVAGSGVLGIGHWEHNGKLPPTPHTHTMMEMPAVTRTS